MLTRTIPCALAAICLAASGVAATLQRVVSPVDCGETLANPGCGLAGGVWSNLSPRMSTSGENLCASSANCTKLWSMHKFSKGYVYGDTYVVQTNHYAHITNFVGGADIPLTESALLAVSNSFLKCRRNGGTCIPRFAYTWDGWGGAEPDDFEVVIGHIRQLGSVLSQFRDVVPAVECGIIGAYGEMHTSRYTAKEYQNRVVGAWLECLPTNMALLVRSPSVWMKYLDTTTSAFFAGGMDSMDRILRARMGFFNDGYLGTDYDYGTWGGGGGTTTWSRSEGRAFLKDQAVSYGGEFAGVTTSYFDENVHLLDPSRFNIVAEWYDTHLSYLRTIQAYGMTVVQKLTNTFFSASRWAFDGMPDLSEYEGVDLRKFCEDHMGYRYVVRDVAFEGYPRRGHLEVEVENTGFGQLLFDDAFEIVLSGESGVFRLRPCEGSSVTLRGIVGGKSDVLLLDFDYPGGLPSGEYDVLLRVWTPLADEHVGSGLPRRPIRFANDGGWNDGLKANWLCSVSIDEDLDFADGALWFLWNAARQKSVGGRWLAEELENDYRCRNFAVDSGVPKGRTGEICVDIPVSPLGEIPQPDGGAASFVFLGDRNGNPVPYGYCAEGWRKLSGCPVTEGSQVVLRIRLSGNYVSYAIGGKQLRDESGRAWLPAASSPRTVSRLSFLGESDVDGFFGILDRGERGSSFRVIVK